MLALMSLDISPPSNEPTEEPTELIFNTTDITDCCCNKWELIYEIDGSQNIIYGSVTDLINAVESGADIKIITYSGVTYTPDWTVIRDGHIYAQQTKAISLDLNQGNGQYIQYPAYWYFTVFKTDGTHDAQRYYIDGEYLSESQNTFGAKWFIKY